MAIIKKSLGRGLSALIPEQDMEMLREVARDQKQKVSKTSLSSKSTSTSSPGTQGEQSKEINGNSDKSASNHHVDTGKNLTFEVPIDSIEANPYQPRRFFQDEEMSDLANSIREHGVIQPIVVRPLADASKSSVLKYQLVAGERRWRASQIAQLATIPAIVRDISDQEALELALIENVQRHDISSVDAALAYRRLADEFGLSQESIAQRVGKSRSAVANTMRLLDLQAEIRTGLEKGEISEGHGRAILLATGDGARRALYRRVVRDSLSVRETERLAKTSEQTLNQNDPVITANNASPDLKRIESALQKRLGSRVGLHTRARGGRIVIEYSSVEELQRIIKCIGA